MVPQKDAKLQKLFRLYFKGYRAWSGGSLTKVGAWVEHIQRCRMKACRESITHEVMSMRVKPNTPGHHMNNMHTHSGMSISSFGTEGISSKDEAIMKTLLFSHVTQSLKISKLHLICFLQSWYSFPNIINDSHKRADRMTDHKGTTWTTYISGTNPQIT